ncbi:hypothetical protein QYS49_05480 [Marivirga salinae]|uniref:Uncharacterized protein n=1 Tax=Marivirga salinarum TaxID=3059078 RepID=A0AA49GAZ0_9BACT|nr:hypothetical protein [Marivirga sp. BDSF4-3]WKK76733.2 hypothetical protein QYS49_05480 [Marivirga sp. BDSF4-3]
MKKLFALALVTLISFHQVLGQEDKEQNNLPLDLMVTVINNSINEANSSLKDNPLNIKKAVITLKTSYNGSGGGGFSFFVKAEKKWQLEKAHTLTYTYEKPSEAKEKSIDKMYDPIKLFEKKLAEAIFEAADQWNKVSATVEGLPKKEFTVELSFTFKKITSAGIEFEIFGIGGDGSIDYENSATHKIALTFH